VPRQCGDDATHSKIQQSEPSASQISPNNRDFHRGEEPTNKQSTEHGRSSPAHKIVDTNDIGKNSSIEILKD
jgi:hypothetical protein